MQKLPEVPAKLNDETTVRNYVRHLRAAIVELQKKVAELEKKETA